MRCCKYRVYLRKFQIFKRKSSFFNISAVSSVHYLPSDFTPHENASKTFVLIVGEHTNSLTKGGCLLCSSYNSWTSHCARNYSVDHRSYVRYECDKAVEADLNIIVIYNAKTVNKNKCPESVRYTGIHVPAFYTGTDGKTYWNYTKIRDAIMN